MRHFPTVHAARIGALACLFFAACTSSEPGTGNEGSGGGAAGNTGTGGATAGTAGSGDATGTAGAGAGGTASGTGGTAGSGVTGTGGSGTAGAGAGGTTGAGGSVGSGGATGRGGAAGTGTTGRGGAAGSGTAGRGGAAGTGTAGTGGTSSTGTGGSSSNCMTPPAASPLVGWAAYNGSTTGGGTATPQMVSTVSALNTAAAGSTAAVIYVTGVLPNGMIKIGSNKTVVGLCGAEIHGHVDVIGSSNVIIRNIKIVGYAVGNCALDPNYTSTVGCSSGNDAITVEQGSHIWFDHDDISDGTDGNLDITLGANYVTVSWTKFHYSPRTDNTGNDSTGAAGHRYSNLVGGGDNSPSDMGKLNITWHHNWWADNVVERQPRVRYGQNHLFNNLWSSSAANYCVRAGMDAQILVENSAFVGVKNPQQFNSTADQMTSYITSTGNLYSGTSGTQSTGGGGTPFTSPPYTYTADPASGVQAAVMAGAGPQ